MPVYIPSDIRLGVIYEWLRGNSRDKIAGIYNISSGGVTNIINEWRNNIGAYKAEDLRELSVSLKKINITPIQCSIGFRVAKIMQRLGITEDQFESFMSEVYDRCQKLELGPDQIEKYLSETINISKIVFPSQIPHYISTKKLEMDELEKQIENKNETISELNKEISDIEYKQKLLINNSNMSVDAIKLYKDIQEELRNMEIPLDDIPLFIQCIREIKNEGYNANKVLTKYSELIYFEKLIEMQEETKQRNLQEIKNLKNGKMLLEEQINWDRLKISQIEELKNIGFGLKELKTIYHTIQEIAKENNTNPKETLEKFFNDLNEYHDIVDFKKKVIDLRKEASNLSMQIATNRATLLSQQHIATILQHLLRIGISEKDIADINTILLLGGFDYCDDNNNNNIIINKQSLISELTRYREIKLVNISLEQKQRQVTNSIKELENKKIVLENYIHQLFIVLSNLKEIQLLVKKTNIALEYPKILLIYLFSDSNNDDKNKDCEDDNTPKKP